MEDLWVWQICLGFICNGEEVIVMGPNGKGGHYGFCGERKISEVMKMTQSKR